MLLFYIDGCLGTCNSVEYYSLEFDRLVQEPTKEMSVYVVTSELLEIKDMAASFLWFIFQ